ncbi:MBL fold metallo-hydrolase [Patescibacteria group bacterium]
MTITWYGHSCFKIVSSGGQLTIITDPFDKKIGLNPPRGNADIITVSHNHYDHNNIKAISGESFVVDSPGEYGIKGVSIKGIQSFHDSEDKELNTIYIIKIDKIRICHLGDFGQKQLTDKQIENIGQVDILMIPVGGKYTIGASQAVKVIEKIDPRMVIPMHYKIPKLNVDIDSISGFLDEMGIKEKEAVSKLTLKKKDLSSERMEIVVMKP